MEKTNGVQKMHDSLMTETEKLFIWLKVLRNPFTELPFVKNNALKTLKIARTPFGIFKSNILKAKQFYAACEIEDPLAYAADKSLYLSATKKYYSSLHPSGYYSYH